MKIKKSTASAAIILVALMTIIGLSGLGAIFSGRVNRSTVQNQNQPAPNIPESLPMSKINLTTKDGIKIVANSYPVENATGWVVFSHMMPATKESWDDLAKTLQSVGYGSVAIDLRGHGESDGGPDGYNKFSDGDHPKSILDLEAAVDYLIKEKGATLNKIVFIGASIGANLSLEYISNPAFGGGEAKTAILLSPGLNYRSIKTEPMVKNLMGDQKVFFVSAKDDTRSGGNNNAEEVQKLYDLTPGGVEKKNQIYETGGHGTDILKNQPELASLIIDFIK
jgi:alpha-beta hydrolase superfamily lysophospholipase